MLKAYSEPFLFMSLHFLFPSLLSSPCQPHLDRSIKSNPSYSMGSCVLCSYPTISRSGLFVLVFIFEGGGGYRERSIAGPLTYDALNGIVC